MYPASHRTTTSNEMADGPSLSQQVTLNLSCAYAIVLTGKMMICICFRNDPCLLGGQRRTCSASTIYSSASYGSHWPKKTVCSQNRHGLVVLHGTGNNLSETEGTSWQVKLLSSYMTYRHELKVLNAAQSSSVKTLGAGHRCPFQRVSRRSKKNSAHMKSNVLTCQIELDS